MACARYSSETGSIITTKRDLKRNFKILKSILKLSKIVKYVISKNFAL